MSDQLPPLDLPGSIAGAEPDFADRADPLGAEPGRFDSPWRRILRRFLRDKAAVTGLFLSGALILVGIFAPLLERYPYTDTNIPGSAPYLLPSREFWLGTDSAGRDIYSRLVVGTRASLFVAGLVVVFAALVALPLGLIAGYFGRWIDSTIMRCMDALFTFPALTFSLAVVALLGNSLVNAAIAISISFVPGFVRLVRAQVLTIREETFVEASRAVGASHGRMLRKHVFPNTVSPIIVQLALALGYAILAEAGLGFLGYGVQIPEPSWGNMLQDGYGNITTSGWQMIPPGVAILIAVLAFNLVGDGFRDALGRAAYSPKAES